MNDLKKLFENLGFENCKTYIQSGNVVFKYNDRTPEILEELIQNEIKRVYGIVAPVLVLTIEKFSGIISNNPFLIDKSKKAEYQYVTFLATKPCLKNEEDILRKKSEHEEIVITRNAVYLYCPFGYGKTKLNNNFLEKKLKTQATTRNRKTAHKLIELASELH